MSASRAALGAFFERLRALTPWRYTPRGRRWALAALLYALALTQARLLNVLGYEFAFASALFVSLSAAHEGLALTRARLSQAHDEGSLQGSRSWRSWWSLWWRAGRNASALALIPLVVMALNELLSQSCDRAEGLLYYLLLPGVTAWVASGWGLICAAFGRGFGSYLLAYLVSVLYALWQVYAHPLIDPFHPLLGYYPGAIYDEELSEVGRLLASRADDLAWVTAIISALALWRGVKSRSWRALERTPKLIALLSALALLGATLLTQHLDISRSASRVQARLGGQRSRERFVIYYPSSWSERAVSALAMEIDFLYEELVTFFERAPSEPLHVYFYDNVTQKKRLMGAGRTRVAKPWQRSVHLHQPLVGQSVLLHELAHAFSAELAPSPHHLSLYRGLIPHMPLIEGLAEAATWSEGSLTPHQLSAALRQEGLAPPLSRLLHPGGFYLSSSSVAYTMCGSFVRFYRERRGQAALEALYRGGGELPEEELARLVLEWEQMIDALTLNPQERKVVAQRLNRPSIFYKVCPHEVAEMKSHARRSASQGAWEEALSTWREVLNFMEGDHEATLGLLDALIALHQEQALEKELSEALTRARARDDQALELELQERATNASWGLYQAPQALNTPQPHASPHASPLIAPLTPAPALSASALKAAADGYSELLERSPSRSTRRRLAVKRACATRQALRLSERGANERDASAHSVHTYDTAPQQLARLLASPPKEGFLEALTSLEKNDPEWGVLLYLKARATLNERPHDAWRAESVTLLERALEAGLPQADLQYEALRLISSLTFSQALKEHSASQEERQARYLLASERFEALSERDDVSLTAAEREELRRWARRSRHFARLSEGHTQK